ncbi:MAG TPA: hypothetical protein VGJ70_14690 [Solirubrobacteraceae bacterium]|jgi:hypothetical protein
MSDRPNAAVAAAGVIAILLCAAGPAILGAVAGGAVGGWLGIVVACGLAAAIGALLYRRRGKPGC